MALIVLEPSERLAPGLEAPPPVEPGLGDRLVVPAVDPQRHGDGEAQRGPDERVPALAARLQEADRDRRILTQPAGNHATGGAPADDHVVELIHARTLVG